MQFIQEGNNTQLSNFQSERLNQQLHNIILKCKECIQMNLKLRCSLKTCLQDKV